MTSAGFADAPDAALAALCHAFETGVLALPAAGGVLFLGARAAPCLRALARPDWLCEQSFLPFAIELERTGLRVGEPEVGARFPLVLALPRRQREENRALFARALAHLAPGGTLAACMSNAAGAASAEADLARLGGDTQRHAKHKCRVFWVTPEADAVDQALCATWLALDAPRVIAGGYVSRPGLFAWDRIDTGSALLAENLPPDLAGQVADLGAGYGYLGTELVARCAGVRTLHLYEAEARALGPLRDNLRASVHAAAAAGRTPPAVDVRWHDVTTGLPERYDAIVMNPPFHQGRADLPELGRAFIASAAAALAPGGRLFLVANRHLPYEATLAARFGSVRTLAGRDGFKVIEAGDVRA